jgi:5-hydroxyisourate hydrolase-like protein (transthyretin family)
MNTFFYLGRVLPGLVLFLLSTPLAFAQLVPTGSISGVVWKDTNNNGRRDPGELGVGGVRIHLWRVSETNFSYNFSLGTATTSSDGRYRFHSLKKGIYSMRIVAYSLPEDCQFSLLKDAGGVPDDLDSDFYPYAGTSDKIMIDPTLPGQLRDNSTQDAALIFRPVPPWGSLGGIVWKDLNDNGIRDAGEPGIKGVEVSIGNLNESTFATDTTDEEGRYFFARLRSEWYQLRIHRKSIPDSLMLSSKKNIATDGGNDLNDSDFDAISFKTDVSINTNETGIGRDNPAVDAALIARPPQTQKVDLTLSRYVNKRFLMPGEDFLSTLYVKNQGEAVVHDIEFSDYFSNLYDVEFEVISYYTNSGFQLAPPSRAVSLIENAEQWDLNYLQPGNTVSVTTYARVLYSGVWYNTAEITYMAEKDDDSTPNNNAAGEDDIATTCFSVPYLFKKGESSQATFRLPPHFSGVVWQRKAPNGTITQVGVGNTLEVTENEPGTYEYSFTSTSGLCPPDGCCPGYVIVEESCPPGLCTPVTTRRIRVY